MEEQQASSNAANVNHDNGAPKCLYCKLAIEENAVVCHNCGRSQRKFWIWIDESTRITAIAMVLIAVVQVMLAYQQGQDAKNERIAASEALHRAKKTEAILDSLLSKELKKLQFRNTFWSGSTLLVACEEFPGLRYVRGHTQRLDRVSRVFCARVWFLRF